MNARDLADHRRIDDHRATGGHPDQHDPAPSPVLRGLGWGLLVAVVAAVVLFATVLVVEGRARQAPLTAAPAPVAASVTSTAPPTRAPAPSGALSPVPQLGSSAGAGEEPAAPPTTAPPVTAPPAAAPPTTPPARPAPAAAAPVPPPDGLSPARDGLRSVDSRTSATLVLTNRSGGRVTVEWVDYRGRRVSYGDIADGASMELGTFVTHPWVISDATGQDLGVALPRAPQSTVVIGNPG